MDEAAKVAGAAGAGAAAGYGVVAATGVTAAGRLVVQVVGQQQVLLGRQLVP